MPNYPIPRCTCGRALQPYVSLSLHDGQRRQSYVAHLSVPLAWTPSAGSEGAAGQPLRGVWAADADDLLRFGDDRAGQPPQHDIHFYVTTARGAIERTTAAGHATRPVLGAEGDTRDGR
jgi:hypothetical protein